MNKKATLLPDCPTDDTPFINWTAVSKGLHKLEAQDRQRRAVLFWLLSDAEPAPTVH